MKKHLITGTVLLTLALTATTLYAQATGGTSIVDKMKAVAHNFTLSSTLNPTDTGLTSDPVKGKKTGDILTAGEWNRMLELVGEGGATGSNITWANFSGTGAVVIKGSNNIASITRQSVGVYKVTFSTPKSNTDYGIICTSGPSPAYACTPRTKATDSFIIETGNHVQNVDGDFLSVIVTPFDVGGSSGGTGSQVSSRAAAVRASGHPLNIPSGITDWPDSIVCDGYGGWAGGTEVLSLDLTGNNVVGYTQSEGIGVFFDPSTGVLSRADRVGACGASPGNIATICAAGRCVYGGGASVAGGLALYKCTNAQSMDSTNAPCYGASRNGGAGTSQYRVVSCTDNDGTRSYTMSSILNFGQLVTNKWAVSVNGGTIECDDGTVLVMDTQGGGSGGSTSSSWVDVPLTDTANFDTSCAYKFKTTGGGGSGVPAGDYWFSAGGVGQSSIIYVSHSSETSHINANSKTVFRVNGAPIAGITVTQIQKRCN